MVRSGSPFAGAPFLRLLLPLCLGVSLPFNGLFLYPLTLLTLLLFLWLILLFFKNGSFYTQPIWGVLLFLTIFLFGVIRVKQTTVVFPLLQKQRYFVVLDEYPLEKEKTYQVVGQLVHSGHGILVYLPKSPRVNKLIPGDIFCFDGLPELVENDGNPFEFDYRGYLNNKGIGYRIFLKENQFCCLSGSRKLNIYRSALIFREKLIKCLYDSGITTEHVHLISSISFGAREDVDKETIQSFTNTGVIHVLAVSGMNVGLIYVILDFIFRFLRTGRAGFFPSCNDHALRDLELCACNRHVGIDFLRAAMMFSFVLVGRSLQRSSNLFNSLAVSAFLLISWDPPISRDVGFQLSYAAVLSIVVIQSLFYRQLYLKNWILDKIWVLICVTFAAQIGTLPLTLHYFHQFPVYFWLANLVVIPLVSLILYLSFVVVCLTFVSGFLSSVIASILDWSVQLVLWTVRSVETFPVSVIRGLYPSFYQFLLFFLIGLFFFTYTKSRKIIHLQAMIVLAVILFTSAGIASWHQLSRAEIIFYHLPGTRALVLTSGREAFVLYDRCDNAAGKLGYAMKPYLGERKNPKSKHQQFV